MKRLATPPAPTLTSGEEAPGHRPRRARSAQAKDDRRAQLLLAARGLFASADFQSVTMAQICADAGVAKGTAYLYFASKETLFLQLVQDQLQDWVNALVWALEALTPAAALSAGDPTTRNVRPVSQALARSLAERPLLCRLLALLHGALEPQVADAQVLAFKQVLLGELQRLSVAIVRPLPELKVSDAVTLVLQLHALCIGGGQMTLHTPALERVVAMDDRLKVMRVDFETFLASTLETLVWGLLWQNRDKRVPSAQ